MHTVETKQGKSKHTVIFYDSIKKLPYRRYHQFNKHMCVQLEVGDSIEDYSRRMARAVGYLNADDSKSAGIELVNQQQCLHNILEGYSPKGMALAVMVHSIDGVKYTDYEEEGLNEILDKLEEIGYNKEQVDENIKEVKKKSLTTLTRFISRIFRLT